MADGPYRHFGAGGGQQQQHFFYQQNHGGPPARHIARTGSPIGGRNLYNNDTPSPSRSPVSQQGPARPFNMFNQGQAAQNSMMNGGGGGQHYMGMNMGHNKYQHQQPHQQQHHHGHHPQQQQAHGGHHGHNGMGHQHTFSNGLNSTPNYNPTPNGTMNEEQNNGGEQYSEHWQKQLQMFAESRQTGQVAHKHSRKGGAALAARGTAQAPTEESSRQGEQVERNRPTINEEPRQDWDGLDMSGQGLRCLNPRLFHDYSFLTKLFVDNNKITALPYTISSLRNLTVLQASGNHLRELPDTIGMLSKLEQLLVFDNSIHTLPTEIGYLFKLEMLGIEGNPLDEDTREFLVQHGTQALVTHLRDSTEAGPPPNSRPLMVIDDQEAKEKFTVLDYNILCNKYATRSQYRYTPAKALDWSYRRDLILGEIKALNADLVCLQEVDQENYHEFFRLELAMLGYRGIFSPKSRAKTMTPEEAKLVDGCAIFYKEKKFHLLDKHMIDFGNIAINLPEMRGQHDVFNRVMPRDHIAIAAFFETRATGSRLIVANAHMFWDPKFDDVKLVQAAVLMGQTAQLAEKWARAGPCKNKTLYRHSQKDEDDDVEGDDENGKPEDAEPEPEVLAPSQSYASGAQIPVVVCGDFNSPKDSGVYQYLSEGFVEPDHPDWAGWSYGKFTQEGIAHPFKLRSAYNGSEDAGGERDYLEFTNYTPGFSGCIEYIWHSTSLRCRQLLGNVDFDYLQKIPGFPNFHFPSDHIPLFAEFGVEPRKERKVVEADFGGGR